MFIIDYMTIAETMEELIAIHHILDHMECKQSYYFFIILDEDSWGILTVIPCEKMTKGNCITAKAPFSHS